MNSTMRNTSLVTRPLVAGMAILISMILPAQTFDKGFDQLYEKKASELSEAGTTV